MRLRLLDGDRIAFLENLVYCNEGFEGLDLVGKDGLPVCKSEA